MNTIEYIKSASVFVRVDDLGADDFPNIQNIVSICKEMNIPVILAVIPERLNTETSNYLCDEIKLGWPGLIIAQHGVRHIPYQGHNKKMEFSLWEPIMDIITQLLIGRNILYKKIGIIVDWYVPPWNKYGRNVIRALEKLQYKAFSASTRLPFVSNQMENFPINQDIVLSYKEREIEPNPEKWYEKTKGLLAHEGWCGLMLHHHLMKMEHIHSFREWAKMSKEHSNYSDVNMKEVIENSRK